MSSPGPDSKDISEQNLVDILHYNTFEKNPDFFDKIFVQDEPIKERSLEPNIFENKWNKTCLDTGAQSTVVGLCQSSSNCQFVNFKIKLHPSAKVSKLGAFETSLLAAIIVRIPIEEPDVFSKIDDVVSSKILFLAGLGLFDKYKLYAVNS